MAISFESVSVAASNALLRAGPAAYSLVAVAQDLAFVMTTLIGRPSDANEAGWAAR